MYLYGKEHDLLEHHFGKVETTPVEKPVEIPVDPKPVKIEDETSTH